MYYEYVQAMKMRHSVDAQCTYARMLLKLDHDKYPDTFEKARAHVEEAGKLEKGYALVRSVAAEINQAQMEWNTAHRQSASALPHDSGKDGDAP